MSTTVVTPQDRKWLEELRQRAKSDVDACWADVESAKQRHTQAIERLAHVQALLDLERTTDPAHGSGIHARADSTSAGSDRQAVDMAALILAERNAAVHYREIYGELERRGVLIKGASPANTLLTRMLRDGRFKPAGPRGTYVLDTDAEHKHFRPQRRGAK